MASIISGIIPPQQFEIIRNKIGLILFEEIGNQFVLTADEKINAKIFVERFIPFDKTDFPCINVLLSDGNYENQNTKTSDGSYSFFIDVYTAAKTTPALWGDSEATFRLHKLMGLCRAILANPQYRNLGFAVPKISRTKVDSIGIKEPQNNQDATCSIMGRLTFTVRANEDTQLLGANLINSYKTQALLNLTDKGYLFENI